MSKITNPMLPTQATGGAPTPPPRDWRDSFAELERARAAYQQALKAGNVPEAEALAGEVARLESALQAETAPLAARQPRAPRPPARGEEAKLRRRLEAVTKKIEGLEADKARLLAELVDEDSPDFRDVTRIDYELSRTRYASEALQARLAEIAQYRADQERAKRLQAELAERERKVAQEKAAIEKLDKLAAEIAESWQKVIHGLAEIERQAKAIDRPAEYWTGRILELCGAVRSPVQTCGIAAPLVFPAPWEK